MKRIILTLTLILSVTLLLSAQSNKILLKGQVKCKKSNSPVMFANVYLANTTIGVVTNDLGYFQMEIPEDLTELVISHVNFETTIFDLSNIEKEKTLTLVVQPKVLKFKEVKVKYKDSFTWKEKYTIFRKYFFGNTPGAKKCKILNPDNLFMYFNPDKGIFKAFCDSSLVIQNKELGYKIVYDLVAFDINSFTGRAYYAGYPFFVEMIAKNEKQKKEWEENREKVYYGSQMHFFRTVMKKDLEANGYQVFVKEKLDPIKIDSVKKGDKLSVNGKTYEHSSTASVTNEKSKSVSFITVRKPQFVKTDNFQEMGFEFENDELKSLSLDTEMKIIYLKEKPHKLFIKKNPRANKVFQVTYLQSDGLVDIDNYGNYYPPANLMWGGYMSWEKMGELLPLDYMVE